MPTTPTPGSRCGSPATAGRISTRRRPCRSAPPSPGATALHDVGSALRRVPPVPVVVVLAAAGLVVVLRARGAASRPTTWAERLARGAERAGRRAGRPRRPAETLGEYAARLDALSGPEASTWTPAGRGRWRPAPTAGHDPPPPAQRALVDGGPAHAASGLGGARPDASAAGPARSDTVVPGGSPRVRGATTVEARSTVLGRARSAGAAAPGPRCRRSTASTPRRRCGRGRACAGPAAAAPPAARPGPARRPCRSGCPTRRSSGPCRAPA